jgi:hypothetical protein
MRSPIKSHKQIQRYNFSPTKTKTHIPKNKEKERDLMDWRVHGIGANWAFEQLMDAGGRSNSSGTHKIVDGIGVVVIIVVVVSNVVGIAGLVVGGREFRVVMRMKNMVVLVLVLMWMMMMVDLILIQIR